MESPRLDRTSPAPYPSGPPDEQARAAREGGSVSSPVIDVLVICTGNICRSPMGAALLGARLAERGVEARVHSAGLLHSGQPVPDHGVDVMATRGLDTSGHRSRRLSADLAGPADLVVTMTREHVREIVATYPDTWPRVFTLKEIVRRGEQLGPRRPDQPLEDYLAALHHQRRPNDLLGDSPTDDVADPIGAPRRVYERTAAELEDLTGRLAHLLAGPPGHC